MIPLFFTIDDGERDGTHKRRHINLRHVVSVQEGRKADGTVSCYGTLQGAERGHEAFSCSGVDAERLLELMAAAGSVAVT